MTAILALNLGDRERSDDELLDLTARAVAEGRNLQLGTEVTREEAERISMLASDATEREIEESGHA